jgi:hypothetical protein
MRWRRQPRVKLPPNNRKGKPFRPPRIPGLSFTNVIAQCVMEKGTGPPPESRLGKATPDLTTLSKHDDGKFPETCVTNVLRNGVKLPDHRSAEMPAWGEIFNASNGANQAQTNLRIRYLADYLNSLQTK